MHRQSTAHKPGKSGLQKGRKMPKATKAKKNLINTTKAKKSTSISTSSPSSHFNTSHHNVTAGHSAGLDHLKHKKTGSMSFFISTLSTPHQQQHSTKSPITSQQRNMSGIAPQYNHPAFRHLGHLNGMIPKHQQNNNTQLQQHQRAFSSSTTSQQQQQQPTPLSTAKIASTFKSSLPPPTYQQKLHKMLIKSRDPAIHTVTKRHIMSGVKQLFQQIISSTVNIVAALKNLTNPFRNKRGNTISLDGSVPWQYHVRNAAIVAGLGAAALLGGYLIIKSLLLALKVACVVLVFNFLRKKLIEHSLKKGDLDSAIMFETWGESHSNNNMLAKLFWCANPISWWKQIHYYISIDRRKQERSKEIAQEVTKQISRDTRMEHLFGGDFYIGDMDRNVGELGLEEESTYAGFITIPIYSSAPTVIDIDTTSSNSFNYGNYNKKGKRITGTHLPNDEALKAHSKELDAEFKRRMERSYGRDEDKHTWDGSMEILDQIKQEYLDSIDPNEDINYKYKYYKALPKWKWDEMDPDDQQSLITGKKEAYYNNRNIQHRINVFDFETISMRWNKMKWDFRKERLHSRDGVMLPTADPDLVEVGTIYAFFSVPALDNAVGEKNNRISIDAMNVLTQGTLLPFELEKVFVVGEKVEKFTLFHKDVAKWSINPSLTKDRTITSYRKARRDEQEEYDRLNNPDNDDSEDDDSSEDEDGKKKEKKKHQQHHKPQNPPSQTRVVDFDLENNKPVVEAEVVHAEPIDYGTTNNNNNNNSSSPGKVIEAEVYRK